jgi:hypothetical protein
MMACFCASVIPGRRFLMGLRLWGVFAGVPPVLVGMACVALGEPTDGRFFGRTGAIL